MINKETIISVYNEKLTLLQWLKTINKALDEAVLTNVEIAQRGNATFVFVFTFEDGTQVESNEIIVNQGESIVGATIENGHLLLTLSNDDVLDAGNVKPVSSFSFNSARHLIVTYGDGTTQDLGLIKGVSGFSIDANQHLIVTYDNGTTEDLGAIFDGNVNINGNFTANSIIENMNGLSYKIEYSQPTGYTYAIKYYSAVKNGNKLTYVLFGSLTRTSEDAVASFNLGKLFYPSSVGAKLIPYSLGGSYQNYLDNRKLNLFKSYSSFVEVPTLFQKESNLASYLIAFNVKTATELNVEYLFRYEITFLLSDNLAS